MNSLRFATLCITPLLLAISTSLTAFAQKAEPRIWTLEGQKVEATLIDFNGTHVLLQDADWVQDVFTAEQMSPTDVKYVKSMINDLKLQIRNDRVLHGIDVWRVVMQGQNGSFYRNYQGASNVVAMAAAASEFPNARIQSVSKISREGRGIRARVRLQNQKLKKAKRESQKSEKAKRAEQKKAQKAASKGNKKGG